MRAGSGNAVVPVSLPRKTMYVHMCLSRFILFSLKFCMISTKGFNLFDLRTNDLFNFQPVLFKLSNSQQSFVNGMTKVIKVIVINLLTIALLIYNYQLSSVVFFFFFFFLYLVETTYLLIICTSFYIFIRILFHYSTNFSSIESLCVILEYTYELSTHLYV